MEPDHDAVRSRWQSAITRVQRELQTEEHLQAFLERSLPSTLYGETQLPETNRRLHCRFSYEKFRRFIYKMFPVLNWLFSYQFREWILKDLHAGLNIGMIRVPQGLLGVWLTGLPLPMINGFLSAFCCSMLYAVFGTSHHISIGSFSILNLVVKNILKSLHFNETLYFNSSQINFSDPTHSKDYMELLTLTASITFMTGIIQLILGFCCLGLLTAYLPKALIDAYLSAAALHVIVSQFCCIFDIMLDYRKDSRGVFGHVCNHAGAKEKRYFFPHRSLWASCGPHSIFVIPDKEAADSENVFHYLLAIPRSNATSVLLFLVSVAILQASKTIRITYKHSPIAFPMELLLIITATIIANHTRFHAASSSAAVSLIPQRLLPPTVPDLSNLGMITQHALSLAFVSCFLLVFVGERYASLHNYSISSSQELRALGLCNICSSFFKSFAISCVISGTVIQEKTGGRTQLAAVMGASLMLLIGLKLGHFFQMIPNCVLAAIVIFNMLPFLEKLLEIPTLWRKDKYHFVIWLVTFAAVLCLGLDIGLLIALVSSLFIISIRLHRMKMVELGQIPNTRIYRNMSICRAATEIAGVKIFQCCSSISFANMNNFKRYLLHKMGLKTVPLKPSELRALISDSLLDASVESKDFQCSCVYDPPLRAPRVPCTEKLVKQSDSGNSSLSSTSTLNLVRWSKHGGRHNSGTFLLGAARTQPAPPGTNTELKTEKNKDEGEENGVLSDFSIDQSSAWLDQEEKAVPLPHPIHPVHTIILDFSMVQFVDLQGSDLLREIFHMFLNFGITIFIAGCHPSVIAVFEKNEFFDSCVTKEMFFLTLHDAVLAALGKNQNTDEAKLTAKEGAEKLQAEDKEIRLLMKKNRDFFSARKPDNKLRHEEPRSGISPSAQNEAQSSSPQQFEIPPLQLDFQDPEWDKGWKYHRNT